ncbi:hypothetical protein [Ornithinimicrobium kibberense]|uniref:hypothetical protein n=1 Tax=Ornithinimicrobium kibberense TaxID=282060 RepID=UPI00360A9AD7
MRRRASPPSAGSTCSWAGPSSSARRKATRVPSGEYAAPLSRVPCVNRSSGPAAVPSGPRVSRHRLVR